MINKRKVFLRYILNNIITLIMIILTIIFYDYININFSNFNKLGLVLSLPLLNLLQSLIFIIFSIMEYNNNHIKNSKTYTLINRYFSLFLNFGQILILLSIFGVNISLLIIYIEMLGLSMLTLGNYFPKLKSSKYLKSISFNVNNDINKWHTFTRVAGFTYLLDGLFIMILGVLNDPIIIVISFSLIIISIVILQLYSKALGKR